MGADFLSRRYEGVGTPYKTILRRGSMRSLILLKVVIIGLKIIVPNFLKGNWKTESKNGVS